MQTENASLKTRLRKLAQFAEARKTAPPPAARLTGCSDEARSEAASSECLKREDVAEKERGAERDAPAAVGKEDEAAAAEAATQSSQGGACLFTSEAKPLCAALREKTPQAGCALRPATAIIKGEGFAQ